MKEISVSTDSFLMVLELQNTTTTLPIRVIGKTVFSMAKESSLGMMNLIMMETTLKEKSMERVYSGMHQRRFTRESGETASKRGKVFYLMRREMCLREEDGRMESVLNRGKSETKNDTLIR